MTLTLASYLALTMYGEAAIIQTDDAAIAVAHVFLNRMADGRFGEDAAGVLNGFNGAKWLDIEEVTAPYHELAKLVATGHTQDPTNGSLFVWSWQDLKRVWGANADYVARHADWMSTHRYINGELYRLYSFAHWPTIPVEIVAEPVCGKVYQLAF